MLPHRFVKQLLAPRTTTLIAAQHHRYIHSCWCCCCIAVMLLQQAQPYRMLGTPGVLWVKLLNNTRCLNYRRYSFVRSLSHLSYTVYELTNAYTVHSPRALSRLWRIRTGYLNIPQAPHTMLHESTCMLLGVVWPQQLPIIAPQRLQRRSRQRQPPSPYAWTGHHK